MNLRQLSHLYRTSFFRNAQAPGIVKLNASWANAQKFDFYHHVRNKYSLPKKFSSFDEFSNLFPITTKDQLKTHLCSATDVWKKHNLWLSTSGSSGSSLRIPVNKNDLRLRYLNANQLRASLGCNTKLPIIQLWGNSTRYEGKKLALYRLKRKFLDHLAGVHRFEAYNISNELLCHIVLKARNLAGYTIYAYTSFATELANYILANNVKLPAPHSIIVTSETTTSSEIQLLQHAFKSDVYVEYGLVEFGPIALKSNNSPYSFDEENYYIELIDNQIYVTDLRDRYFPLFRYKTEDLFRTDSLGQVSEITGRISDLIFIRTCSNQVIRVHSEIVSHVLKEISNCLSFQCITDSNSVLSDLLVSLQPEPKKPSILEDQIKLKLSVYMQCCDTLSFNIKFNFPFLRNKSGKTPAIYRFRSQ